MNKTLTTLAAAAMAVVMLGGCANSGWNNSDTGTLLGGAAGGALGSQIGSGTGSTIATVVGTLAGAALGNRVGQHFDQKDRRQFGSALESNQTGNTSRWTNPDTNDTYSVTPTQTYQQGNQPCRKFTMNANVNGSPEKVNGTACRQSDGTWKVVNG
ncbi:RT0821/Lpp0805 family surface protein [Salinisphaera sp. Q1T1-3]|uniref:RT0821/Lpp0805 family surface protein n=1 Tax=Salinisphaera sp. Q1T1-3 TaxID=2321229 RepID=UPI000E736914|nr:RT0821/Lpp0805 family surface protein [Salinisphaera sp. Q1T1-3]RJS93752.1 glycine zipper 2TM domain-containing protein [Salinisphaera sp. Q1T1-3]